MEVEHDSILTLALPYRERLHLQRTRICGSAGPRVAVVAGIHGDELEGLYVCHRLAHILDQVEQQQPGVLQGTVELYPMVNPLGLDTLEHLMPSHAEDIDRSFPGHPEGMMPQRVAAAVYEALRGCALVVDIRSSDIYFREIPQVRVTPNCASVLLPLAHNMNVEVTWVRDRAGGCVSGLADALNEAGTPCLVLEMGVGMRITPGLGEQVVVGILNTWKKLGVLRLDAEVPTLERWPLVADDRNVVTVSAEVSGLFVSEIGHWSFVERDQKLGEIVSPLRGDRLADVRAPAAGILFTLREYPLVYEGSLMARILATEHGV